MKLEISSTSKNIKINVLAPNSQAVLTHINESEPAHNTLPPGQSCHANNDSMHTYSADSSISKPERTTRFQLGMFINDFIDNDRNG